MAAVSDNKCDESHGSDVELITDECQYLEVLKEKHMIDDGLALAAELQIRINYLNSKEEKGFKKVEPEVIELAKSFHSWFKEQNTAT